MANYLLADTETTGVGTSDRVVEVAWMVIDDAFNILDEGASLINPLMPIPAGASAVHGITNKDVVDAPTITQYFDDILGGKLGYGDFIFVAHNAQFDYRYLSPFLAEGTPQMCTLRLARKLYPDVDNHKLGTLVYALELEVDKDRFHSADVDMAVLMAMLGKMSEDFGYTLWDLFELANTPIQMTKMTFGKHKGTPLKDLPASYASWLLNKTDNLDPDLRASLTALGFK
jgi:exodeoxyribonuclease X